MDSSYHYLNIAMNLAVGANDSTEIASNLVAIAQKNARQGNNLVSIERYNEARSIMEAQREYV